MKFATGLIFLAFIVLNILGFSSLAHANHMTHHSCLFDFSNTCATLVDLVGATMEHLGNLENSIQAILAGSAAMILIIALAFVFAGKVFEKNGTELIRYLYFYRAKFREDLFEFKIRFLAWFSVLNKRDDLVLRLAR